MRNLVILLALIPQVALAQFEDSEDGYGRRKDPDVEAYRYRRNVWDAQEQERREEELENQRELLKIERQRESDRQWDRMKNPDKLLPDVLP